MALAITPDGKRAYVERTFAPATVDVFDFTSNSFVASVPLNASPVGQPGQTRGIVIAPRFSTGKLAAYVASSVRIAPGRFSLNLYVIDADPASATFNTVVATLPTGEPQAISSSGAIAVTPDGHFAFVNGFEANATGDLVILDLTSGASTVIPMGTLGVSAFQPALELSPDARFLVLVANDGSAHVFDVSSPAAPVPFATIHGTPPAGFSPLRLQPRIIGNTMYTFDFLQNVVAIFNFNPAANDFSQLATFAFPATPTIFEVVHDVTPDGKLMYLPLREQDSVAVVDTAKVLAGDPSALVTEIGAGISPHLAAVRPVPPVAIATTVRYTGDTTRNYHDIANLSATLVVQGTSSPISGQTITFTLGTQSCAGTTDATGLAACSITLNQVPGPYTVKASFAGSGNNQASSDSAAFTITREETATSYTGPAVIINGANTTFSALLQEDGTTAIAGRTITITLGSGGTAQTCNGITDATGTVSCSIVVNQPSGPGTVAASFTGDALYLPSSGSAASTVVVITATRYTGDTTRNYHDIANLSATLTVQGTPVPIPNQTITFTLGTQSCAGTTGATGVAACSIVLNQVPGFYTVNASFAGSANNRASSDSTGFTITGEETATTYTGPIVIANGASTTFSAVLKEDGILAIAGRTITITLGSSSTAQTCNGTTDATGTASCSILVNQPLGPGTVAASFAGDALYLPSSNGASTILFAFPAQGAFVVGDQTASGAVEFWGNDWATVNILSGGPAPDAFKGFAANTSEPPTCGSAWTTSPGTSSQPPAGTLPSFMGVIVSTRIGQSGSAISGDVSRIVVVTPNAGYDPNAGHAGTGTVVATYCATGGGA